MNSDQRAEAKRIYLANVKSGQPLKVAAVEAGVTMGAVRNWRDSDTEFLRSEQHIRDHHGGTWTSAEEAKHARLLQVVRLSERTGELT